MKWPVEKGENKLGDKGSPKQLEKFRQDLLL